MEQLAATQARLQDLDLAAQKQREMRENPVGRSRGMICRADKYLAQQHRKGAAPGPGSSARPTHVPRQDRHAG